MRRASYANICKTQTNKWRGDDRELGEGRKEGGGGGGKWP